MNKVLLHIDNSEEDMYVVNSLLTEVGLDFEMVQEHDAKQAYSNLTDGKLPKPRLILLDLNLPGMSGLEFLQQARASSELAAVPIIVLSSSIYPREIDEVLLSGANCYIQKEYDIQLYGKILAHNVSPYFK